MSLETRNNSSAQDKDMLHQCNNISCFVLCAFGNNSSQSVCPLGNCWTWGYFQRKSKRTQRCRFQVVKAVRFLCVSKIIPLRIVLCVDQWLTITDQIRWSQEISHETLSKTCPKAIILLQNWRTEWSQDLGNFQHLDPQFWTGVSGSRRWYGCWTPACESVMWWEDREMYPLMSYNILHCFSLLMWKV